MVRLREEMDADWPEAGMQVSNYPTEKTQFELYCDMCGEVYFVDEFTFEKINDALREGFENPFICADCREESDEAAYL